MKQFYLSILRIKVVILFLLMTLQGYAASETPYLSDTLYCNDTIVPFDGTIPALNFPLLEAKPIGDVNGDGFGDLIFRAYPGNEHTSALDDYIAKSALITDIHHPEAAKVFYNSQLFGVGDINADGLDDMIDMKQKLIRFGDTGENFNDTLMLNLPDDMNYIYYKGDITDDGKSDYIVGKDNNSNFLLLYIGTDTIPINFNVSFINKFETLFHYYDHDGNGDKELCMATYSHLGNSWLFKWYQVDTIAKQLHLIDQSERAISDTYYGNSFPSTFADVNGDRRIDLTFVVYNEGNLCIDVCPGTDTPPYFGQEVLVPVNNPNRLLYCAGDLNNDGADDFYSKSSQDSIVVYFGGNDFLNGTVNKQTYYTGESRLFLPQCQNITYSLYLGDQVPVFYYNNDTIPDLFFNYWKFDENLQYDSIGTAIVCGGNSLDFLHPQIVAQDKKNSFSALNFGEATKSFGDINNDNFPDWGTVSKRSCTARLYFGKPVLSDIPDVTILLPETGMSQTWDWDVGDINGDGIKDIIIANSSATDIFFFPSLLTPNDRVFVFFGRENWPDTLTYHDADFELKDHDTFYEMGYTIKVVGDYNDDGYNDFVVGGGKHKHCLREAYLYFGGQQISLIPNLILSVPCTQCGILFPSRITQCGDINNDGFDDFTLGDPSNEQGKSLIYFGGPFADSLYDKVLNNQVRDGRQFGSYTPHTEGDFNHDGYPDLIQYNINNDTIYVYYGGPDFDTTADVTLCDTALYSSIFNVVEYIHNFSQPNSSDLGINSYKSKYLLIFNGSDTDKQSADFALKSISGNIYSMASGDFDNYGDVKLFLGFPYERTYGYFWGGVVCRYNSPVVVNTATSKPISSEEIEVYPNPAKNQISVKVKNDHHEKGILRMLTITHKVVGSWPVTVDQSHQGFENISIGNYPSGTYIIQYQSNNKQVSKTLYIVR